MPERKNDVLRWVWVLVWSVPGCKGHTYRLPTVCTVSAELAGLVVRLSKFTISPPRPPGFGYWDSLGPLAPRAQAVPMWQTVRGSR